MHLFTYRAALALAAAWLVSGISTDGISRSRYGTMSFNVTGNVTRATFDHPPINLVDTYLLSDLSDFLTSLQPNGRQTPPPKAVIFDSANPDIFLEHLDVNQLTLPLTEERQRFGQQWVNVTRLLQGLTSTVFIGEINGVGWGAGLELSAQMDLRFAGPKTNIGLVEYALGVIAGQGGQLFLGSLVGKGRAIEHTLAVQGFDGPSGTAAGLFNHNYNSTAALHDATFKTAQRISNRLPGVINATKASLGHSLNPTMDELNADAATFNGLFTSPTVQSWIQKYLKASNNQTNVTFELQAPDSYLSLIEA